MRVDERRKLVLYASRGCMDSRAVLCAVRIASCTDEGREEITTRDALLSGACGHCAGRSYPAQYPVVYNVVDSTRVLAAAVAYVAWSALHCSFERPRLEPHCHLTHVHVSIVTLFRYLRSRKRFQGMFTIVIFTQQRPRGFHMHVGT